jgi:hypothetical protein
MGETGVGVIGAGSIRSWLIPSALRIVARLLLLLLPAILLLSILILVKVTLWRITTSVLLLLLLLGLRLQSARRLLARC